MHLNSKFLTLYFMLFTLSSTSLRAQPEEIKFTNRTKGLSQNTITAIAQDEYGFLWIGTQFGLNRYDGVNFKIFESDPTDSLSLSSNHIMDLTTDHNGGIWILTYGAGLHYYDFNDNTFTKYTSDKYPSDKTTSMLVTRDSQVYVGANGSGLFILDKKTKKLKHFNENKPDTKKVFNKKFFSFAEDSQGNVIFGGNNGLTLIKKDGTPLLFTEENGLPSKRVRKIYHKNNRTWVGTDDGLREMILDNNGKVAFKKVGNPTNDSYEHLNKIVILSILEKDNYLWVGSENYGLFQIDLTTNEIYSHVNKPHDPNSISSNSIWNLFECKHGTIWLGGFTSGLDKIENIQNKIKQTQLHYEGNTVWKFRKLSNFVEDEFGNIWIGTDGDGLTKIGTSGTIKNYNDKSKNLELSSNNILSMVMDDQSNIWVGTWGGGVSIIDIKQNTVRVLNKSQKEKNVTCGDDIHAMSKDKDGNIWIAAFREGIDVFHPEKGKICTFNTGSENRRINDDRIFSIHRDNFGHLWIGFDGDGIEKLILNDKLEVIDSKRFLHDDKKISGLTANVITSDSKDNVWIGTSGMGLVKFDKNDNATIYTKTEGLSGNIIYSIEEDDDGNIWVTSNLNICSLNPETEEIQCYEFNEQYSNLDFFKSSSLKTKDGNLYFGGSSGFYNFDPKKLQLNNVKPSVFLTNLKISGKHHTEIKSITSNYILNNQSAKLEHNQNDLTFEFTSISYTNATKNRFKYKLENFDEDWRIAEGERKVTYPNVPPGEYTFKVLGSNNDKLWNEEFASMQVIIKYPWYQTWLAYLAYIMAIVIVFKLIKDNLLRNLQLKNQLKLEHFEVEKMQELDKIKADFFTNISHEFKTPLTLIMSPLSSLMKEEGIKPKNKELYKIIMKNSEYLNRLINQILDISRIESGNTKLKANEYDIVSFIKHIAQNFSTYADQAFITFRVNIPDQTIPIFFDQEKMEKVLINILSNAFKFTPNHGEISINLEEHEQSVDISIVDNGIGIDKENLEKIFERFYKSDAKSSSVSTGIGLALSKQLVNMHRGTLSAKSQQSPINETIFTIRLKKGTEHLKQSEIIKNSEKSTHLNRKKTHLSFQQSPDETIDLATPINDDRTVVLVVEDNDDMRLFISSILNEKYRVIEASNGKIGYEKALRHLPEVIISDVMMPEMNGYQLTKAIKENPLTCHIFMILLSAKSSDGSINEGFKLGVDSYLTKPFNPNLLELNVKNLLQSRKRFKEQIASTEKINLAPDAIPYSKMDEEFISKIISEIEKNMADPTFKVDDLCMAIGFSKSQLYRKLKSLTGKPIKEFVRMIRLKRAAQLLEQNDLRISEVTFETGFNDLQNFRSAFKKQFGMSPKEYREKVDA